MTRRRGQRDTSAEKAGTATSITANEAVMSHGSFLTPPSMASPSRSGLRME
jgi:hypothetical protein